MRHGLTNESLNYKHIQREVEEKETNGTIVNKPTKLDLVVRTTSKTTCSLLLLNY